MPALLPHLCSQQLLLIVPITRSSFQKHRVKTAAWFLIAHRAVPFQLKGERQWHLLHFISFLRGSWWKQRDPWPSLVPDFLDRSWGTHSHVPVHVDETGCVLTDHTEKSIFSFTQFKLKLQENAAQGGVAGGCMLLLCLLLSRVLRPGRTLP